MKASIDLTIQGPRGGNYRQQVNQGAVRISIDYDAVTDRQICLDAYCGQGDSYEKRQQTLVMIYNAKGVPVFSGTFDELVERIRP